MKKGRRHSRRSLWGSSSSIRSARRRLLRWERYALRCEKLAGPSHPANQGFLKAYNRWAGAVNYRNNLLSR
jgi:hypothetical protein